MIRRTGLIVLFAAASLYANTYYVDPNAGSDSNSGRLPTSAWATLEKVNATTLLPGDSVLLCSGCVFRGQLAPRGAGEDRHVILIGRYGNGPLPRIEGAGEDAVLLRNTEYIELRDLEITNRGDGSAVKRGLHILLDNCGTAHSINVTGLFIHDVNGTQKRKDNGGIIFTTRGDQTPSRFDGLTIQGNVITDVDRSGIAAQSSHWRRDKWFPSLNVVIRDNYLANIGGDGIVPWACDGVRVEHNTLRGANLRAGTYNAGIWPWSCDNSVFRYNDVSGVRTLMDGQAYDSDYNSRNTLFEFNYSRENEGGFFLICSPGKRDPAQNAGNVGITIRRNVSFNDGARAFHISAVENALIEDNVVYTGPGLDVQMLLFSNWEGWAKDVTVRNNRFLVSGTARYGHGARSNPDGSFDLAPGWGQATGVTLFGNIYAGNHVGLPSDPAANVLPIQALPSVDWHGPTLRPLIPAALPAYLRAHRVWIETLMRAHFPATADR